MSTSNLNLDYADAASATSAKELTPTWVPFVYLNNIVREDFALGNKVDVDIDTTTSISDSISMYYDITAATANNTLSLTLTKLYIVTNSTTYTHIVNGVSLNQYDIAILYGTTVLSTYSSTNEVYNHIFKQTYIQNASIFISKTPNIGYISGIQAYADIAPTGSIQYKIYNGVDIIGSITFNAASNIGVTSISSNIIGLGSILRLQTPNVADATMAGIAFNIITEI